MKDQAAGISVDEFENGLKNHYYLNKRMTPAAFETEQEYHVRRRRLLNRAIHGWGVVHGFAVAKKPDAHGRLKIGAGLALDDSGRELVQVDEFALAVSDVWEKNRIDKYTDNPNQPWILSVHYAERQEQPITVSDSCQCDRKEWEHTRETVSYSLELVHADSGQDTYRPCKAPGRPGVAGDRGPHDRLCAVLTHRSSPPSDAGLALAYVYLEVTSDACNRRTVVFKEMEVMDTCTLRRLVIGNEMLYDLIRGRDLTWIKEVSWIKPNLAHERDRETDEILLDWDFFNSLFPSDINSEGTIPTGLSVTFSGPVQVETLTSHCFSINVISSETIGGWGETLRVPLRRPHYDAEHNRATLTVDARWVNGEFPKNQSSKFDAVTLVEIEVRGDLILDCCGQPIDANRIGSNPPPTGNGSPGGTFLTSFLLAKRSFKSTVAAPNEQRT